jgi:hypothetical protein
MPPITETTQLLNYELNKYPNNFTLYEPHLNNNINNLLKEELHKYPINNSNIIYNPLHRIKQLTKIKQLTENEINHLLDEELHKYSNNNSNIIHNPRLNQIKQLIWGLTRKENSSYKTFSARKKLHTSSVKRKNGRNNVLINVDKPIRNITKIPITSKNKIAQPKPRTMITPRAHVKRVEKNAIKKPPRWR